MSREVYWKWWSSRPYLGSSEDRFNSEGGRWLSESLDVESGNRRQACQGSSGSWSEATGLVGAALRSEEYLVRWWLDVEDLGLFIKLVSHSWYGYKLTHTGRRVLRQSLDIKPVESETSPMGWWFLNTWSKFYLVEDWTRCFCLASFS